nr:uncharacterized protein LOC111421867 [Onthophagus taurus]XP_022910833.1 uncharacterized protein LOC111421867 [Onthophagus taurus]
MAKLDDLFSKKKETTPILDLSKSVVKSADDFKKLMEKVPEYKIKPEKVRSEDVKLRDKDFKFKTGKKDFKAMNETYLFMDPIPSEMKELKLKDFISIPIDWHMLTTLRPKTKSDEEYFSKIVELGKAEMRTVARDKRIFAQDSLVRKSKNKSGVVEQRIVSCSECGEEYCTGKLNNKIKFNLYTVSVRLIYSYINLDYLDGIICLCTLFRHFRFLNPFIPSSSCVLTMSRCQ